MSAAVMEGEAELTLSRKRKRAFSASVRAEVSKSARTAWTAASLPRRTAATAAWDLIQKGQ